MALEWSQFQFRLLTYGSLATGSWRGVVQPIKTTDSLFELLDDLDNDREVYLVGDEIRHHPNCGFDHCHHEWMNRIVDLRARLELDIWHDGSPAPPRCWVLSPIILNWKHMWWDGSICDSLVSESWNWQSQTVADVIPDILIWLVKWMVYDQTEKWIGTEHENTPESHLKVISPEAPCWCRSPKEYRACHREEDKRLVRIRQGGK